MLSSKNCFEWFNKGNKLHAPFHRRRKKISHKKHSTCTHNQLGSTFVITGIDFTKNIKLFDNKIYGTTICKNSFWFLRILTGNSALSFFLQNLKITNQIENDAFTSFSKLRLIYNFVGMPLYITYTIFHDNFGSYILWSNCYFWDRNSC